MDLSLDNMQSLLKEIIKHEELEQVFIPALEYKSVHMNKFTRWAKFLQRGLERVCFETESHVKS